MLGATDGLAARISAAAAEQGALRPAIERAERRLTRARSWLRVARWPVIRHVDFGLDAALAAHVAARSEELDNARAKLRERAVEVEFRLDAAAEAAHAALVAAFEAMARCGTVWRIDDHAEVDSAAERTVATAAVLRRPVRLTIADADEVRSAWPALSFGDGLFLYPGFLLDGLHAIDVRDLRVTAAVGAFVEDQVLPCDVELLPPTWSKVNRDGSADRRFRDNAPLPVARYGELLMRGPRDAAWAWMTSAPAPASAFAKAFDDHAWAFAGLR